MAIGFKVADAYVDVHVEDGTKRGRDQIARNNQDWARKEGDRTGNTFGAAFMRGMLRGLRGLFSAVLRTALIGGLVGVLGAAVSALAGYVVQLIGAVGSLGIVLYQALGILALLPGVIFTAITALLTLKLAFSGVGAALKAGLTGDMAAFNEALKKLAPNAQAAVREIVALRPAFDRLKMAVQDAVFLGLGGWIKRLGTEFLPVLQTGLVQVGFGLNNILKNIAGGLLGSLPSIASALASVGNILHDVGTGLGPLIIGLTHFLDLSLQILNVGKVDSWLTIWGEALQSLTREDIAGWVSTAITALKALGGLLVDIGGIIAGIFRAAGTGDIFGWFDRIHAWIDNNQALLSRFFGALRLAADALSPVLFELLRALTGILVQFASVMVAIGPTLTFLVNELGAGLISLIQPLVPLLLALGQVLIVAIDPLAMLIGGLVGLTAALGPGVVAILHALEQALVPIAEVAPLVGEALGAVLVALAPLVRLLGPPIAAALTILSQILLSLADLLAPFIQELVDLLLPAMEEWGAVMIPLIVDAFRTLMTVIRPLLPVVLELIRAILGAISVDEVVTIFREFMEVAVQLVDMLGEGLVQFLDVLPLLIPSLLDLVLALIKLAIALMPLIIPATQLLSALIALAGPLIIPWLTVQVQLLTWVIGLLADIVRWILTPFRDFRDKLVELIDAIKGRISDLLGPDGISGVKDKIIGFFVGAWNWLWQAGRDIVQGLINGITSKAGDVWRTMQNLASDIWNSFSGKLRISSPSKLFETGGRDSVLGYIQGWEKNAPKIDSMLSGFSAGLLDLLAVGQANMISALQPAGPSQPQAIYAVVRIGDQPVRDMVEAEIVRQPEAVAAATDEGHRVSAFAADPSRKRVGVR